LTTHRPGLGILLVVLMTVCFATMDTGNKYIGAFVPMLLVMWVRYLFQCVVMAAWLLCRPGPWRAGFRTAHPKFQALRGVLLLSTTALGFYGVQFLPVAEFTAIAMLSPVVVTLLSAWVLHERVAPLRWVFVAGGFLGALIVIRPGSGLFGWEALLPLSAAVTYAVFQTLTSKMAGLDNPFSTHFFTGLVGSVILTPPLWLGPAPVLDTLAALPPAQIAVVALICVMGTFGHLFLILALGVAPTAVLMPFVYLQIGMAALVGFLVFGHVPDGWAALGMAVIAACGAASVWLNMRRAAVPTPAAANLVD